MKRWADLIAALLLLLAGMLSVLDPILEDHYEMAPLAMGLALLLVNHGRRRPLRYLYLLLLVVLLRVILKGDERFLPAEITLTDYILIVLGFAASYRLPEAFWRAFLPLYAIFVPLAALISFLLRRGPEAAEPFDAGTLSINQTSFLLGTCLVLSLCFLWTAITTKRPLPLKWLLAISWTGLTVILLVLENATRSRSGLLIPILSVAAMVALAHRQQLANLIRIDLIPGRVALGVRVGAGALMAAGAAAGLGTMYSNRENLVSDLHRLYLLRCYFQAPFSGGNRLIHGMGFTEASETCRYVGLLNTSHAHNIFAQIAADNGLFAMLATVCILGWLLMKALQKTKDINEPIPFAAGCLYLFIFIILQIEGGWGKVSFLQVLIGLSMGALTLETGRKSKGAGGLNLKMSSGNEILGSGFQGRQLPEGRGAVL